jgi:trans-L-3-hydroxyproline dehydratase
MELSKAINWEPPGEWRRVEVLDSHTGGEPFRVVIGGIPELEGATVLARRRYAQRHMDDLRRILMWEPRGHADMYGGILGPPERDDSDVSILFIHNEGFSTMCGHGIIALTTVLFETGLMEANGSHPTIKIDTPAGQVTATAELEGGSVRSVSFRNVPSFVVDLDQLLEVDDIGEVRYDLAFGGAYYAYVDAPSIGLDLRDVPDLIDAGRRIKARFKATRHIPDATDEDLAFLYGVIFTGEPDDPDHHSRNVCVFADGEVDRSPTGTGVSGRLAILHARAHLEVGQAIAIESIVGSVFWGSVVEETTVGQRPAIVPEVTGSAHLTGRSTLWVDPDDALGGGFLLR